MKHDFLTESSINLLDTIFDGVYIVDRDRKILFWNEAAEQLTGYSKEEVIGRHCRDDIFNHIDENGNLLCQGRCPILKVLKSGKSSSEKVYPLSKIGRRFPVQTNISAIRDSSGEIIAAIEVFRDISIEEDHRILQEKFQNFIKKYVSTATLEEVEKLITSNIATNVKQRDLSILYLDVVGFTTFTEKNSSEEAVHMLNDLFGVCDVITRETLGDIDKFVGDALMATFVDANDAVKAADKILNHALPELNRQRIENGKDEIHIRVGINSGIVLQGNIGTKDRSDLTVIGDVVNTAARIEHAADADHLFISESTVARLDENTFSRFEEAGTIKLKGKSETIKVYRLAGVL